VKLGPKTVDVFLKDVVFDAVDGNFPHPNTMTVKIMAGNNVLLEQEYYSVGDRDASHLSILERENTPCGFNFLRLVRLTAHPLLGRSMKRRPRLNGDDNHDSERAWTRKCQTPTLCEGSQQSFCPPTHRERP
jgi:hypothetical protein